MQERIVRVYLNLIVENCRVIHHALGRANEALDDARAPLASDRSNEADLAFAHTKFFDEAQAVVVAAANIAKILWTAGGKRQYKRTHLRELLAVTDESPLKNVALRNHYEHIDERIERWSRDSKRRNLVDRAFGARSTLSVFDEIDIFRGYDPETTTLYFWGTVLNLQEVVDEIDRIAAMASPMARELDEASGRVARGLAISIDEFGVIHIPAAE